MEQGQISGDGAVGLPAMRLVFSLFWNELRETIGSAPTAALLRRAIVMSRDACPPLDEVMIKKEGRDYICELPKDLDLSSDGCDVGSFVDNVLDLLHSLTGTVLVNYLLTNPLIRKYSGKEQ